MIGPRFRLAIHQFAPSLKAPATNAGRIAAAAAESGADLVLTPELALTGYDLGDDAAALAVSLEIGGPAPPIGLPRDPDLVVGLVERGDAGIYYNSAAYLAGGCTSFCHRKLYLPTYGMFDEARFFGHGSRIRAHEPGGGWRLGILVCEDFWHPALAYLLAARGIHALLVLAAAPGRGVWQGGEGGSRFESWDAWVRIARSTAQLYGIFVALANRVGIEDGTTFAGGSLIAAPDGEILDRAGAEDETIVAAELSLDEVERARRPYAHLRDDDPFLTRRELDRALEDRNG